MTTKLTLASVMTLALAGGAFAAPNGGHRRHQPPGRPIYDVRQREVVIPAQYEIVRERVWVEPVYEWVTRQVYVPPRQNGPTIKIKAGKVKINLDLGRRNDCGTYETIREQVLVQEGYWTTVERRILLIQGRVRIIEKKVPLHKKFAKTGSRRTGRPTKYGGYREHHRPHNKRHR